jgi:uncharacterized membrane protein YgdD (TMEM256/DUF423 family)
MPPLLSFPGRKSEPIKIQSPLGVQDCVALLKRATREDSTFKTMFVDAGVILCKFDGNNFRLQQKRSYRNSFAPFFYGEFKQTMSGTEISGEFRMQTSVTAFMIIWFGFLLVIGGTLVCSSLYQLATGHYDHAKNDNPIMGVLIPIGMMVFGFALVTFGKWLGRSEEANMANFLKETFSTNQAASTPASVLPGSLQKDSMMIPILVFALLGLLSLASGFTGISSCATSVKTSSNNMTHSGMAITYYHDQSGRWLSLATGGLLCFMAYGT